MTRRRTGVRRNERGSVNQSGGVTATPIWQTKPERRLFVLAVIELARQLVEEEERRQADTDQGGVSA
jgi:hypothetical protein